MCCAVHLCCISSVLMHVTRNAADREEIDGGGGIGMGMSDQHCSQSYTVKMRVCTSKINIYATAQ